VSGKAEIGGKSRLQDFLSSGKNVLFLNPTAEQAELLPLSLWKISDRFRRSHTFGGGECAFIPPGHPLADGLVCPDDLRWWNPGPAGPSVCEWAFSLPRPEHKNLVSLCDYNAPHGYLKAPQDFENYRAALIFESAVGKGRLIASTLRLADDPIARRIIANLISKYAS
jgi:hypothetical protein